MGILGDIVDYTVGFARSLGLITALIIGLAIWKLPLGMTMATKWVMVWVVVALLYNNILLGEQNFGMLDLGITGVVSLAYMEVL